VAVLTGVEGKFLAVELAGRPALIERVLEDVVAGAYVLQSTPKIHVGVSLS